MAFSAPSGDIVEEGDDLASFTANEAVTRGQVVKLAGGDLEVQPSDTDGENCIGVATQTVASGEMVTVATEGTEVRFTAGTGTVSRNQYLASHGATGEEGQVARADATGDSIIGYSYDNAGSSGNTFHGVVTLGGEIN